MARVAILSPSVSSGDAVSNDALGMADALTRQGHEVRLFCESSALNGHKVHDATRISSFLKSTNDVLIYHFSRGWEPGVSILENTKCRRVIKYHNVTPAEFFEGYNGTDAELCRRGRVELEFVAQARCDLYLSASAFNMAEMTALGAEPDRSYVVPPFHHIDRLKTITADTAVLEKFNEPKANILTVGRVAPHKGHLTLLEVFANYYFNYNRNSRLLIAGKGGEGHSRYAKLLHQAVHALRLTDAVFFTGEVSDEELKAYYTIADVFVTTSEHEGFCVPLVEAMSMKLPITAFATTAIPETLGDAGLSWPEKDPFLIAESIDAILRDESIKKGLGAKGLRRYESMFTNEKIEDSFSRAMARLS